MSVLELGLLGQPKITLDSRPLILQRNKGQALLSYLAVTAAEHSRQELAALLWELPEERARSNLSVELVDLKKKLSAYLSIRGRKTIAFDQRSNYSLDVARFRQCLATENPTLSDLQTAVGLYRGPFLLGFHVKNAPLFEQWVLTQRAQLEPMAFRAIYTLAAFHSQQREYRIAVNYVDRLLSLEPLVEKAHRQKMLLLALDGQREAALAQYHACLEMFARDYDEPSDTTTELYERILTGEIDESMLQVQEVSISSISPSAPTPPFQAPATVLHFVGRAQEQERLISQLTTPVDSANICSLVGMGGIGKTSLASQLAHQLRDVFVDGVLWANVTISDPMDVLVSWSGALGYDFSRLADLESRAAAWRTVLATKKLLLVLDNVTSVARVRLLLPSGPDNAALLTTRDLDIARALNTEVTLLTELSPENSQELLVHVLGEQRVTQEQEAATVICNLLQHLPLAIEIIAQRLRSRPRRLLSAVSNRLRSVNSRLVELEISDRAVRASFQLSWETLDANLRRTFALLAVFSGRSFGAEALAAIDDSDLYLVEDRLFSLVALSLVHEEALTRYRQHALLADFAAEKLGDAPDDYLSMVKYYRTFARNYRYNYEALSPEWENLSAAINIAVQREQWPLIIEIVTELHSAWFARGRYSEAETGNRHAYYAAEHIQAPMKMAEFSYNVARALVEQSQYGEARQLLQTSLQQFLALDENAGAAKVHQELARIEMDQANFERAEHHLNASKALRETTDEVAGLAEIIEGQARLHYKTGEYASAYQIGLQALSLYEQEAFQPGVAKTLRLLANSIIELHKHGNGRLDQAKSFGQRAIHLAESLQDRGELAVALYVFSRVLMLEKDLQRAIQSGQESLSLLERIGDLRSQAIVLTHLGEVYFGLANIEAALEVTERSLTLCKLIGAELETAVAYSNIGVFHQGLGQVIEAKESWQQALPIALAIGHSSLVERINKRLETV